MTGLGLDDRVSVLSFICPRVPSVGMVEGFRLSSINCNLLADFESCTRDAQVAHYSHSMKVYLRIRPYACDNGLSSKAVLSCPDKCTVIACPPEMDGPKHSFRNLQKSANKFTFNEVFRESDTQHKVFENVAADKIRAFVEGLNGLIFAYGTTSSGKTYTLQGNYEYITNLLGTRESIGIIPRSIYSIFSLVKHKSDPDIRFSFWMSFVEIYNETFYDLLDPTHFVNQPRRTPLELRTDKNGNLFIKGVKWYPVSSPEEALRLLAVGRHCQKVASTRLNQASSRSHSILCVKAVRVVDKNNPNFARVSTLMFCDLAGSERSVKAATGGQTLRIREAGNINSSLLTLGRCIECLRYNQVHPDNPKLVPYRDSKLTRLFQGFFTGQGRACMIVNASPNPELFDETLHALRFAALARQVIVEVNPVAETSVLHPNKVKCKQKNIKQIKSSNQPIATKVVESDSVLEPQSPRWSEDDLDKKTLSLDEVSGEVSSPVDLEYLSSSQAMTPSNNDGTELVLDHFNKEELITMVKDLSEQLFESKGQLVEQEARLRAEMCDNMNQQIIDFENKFEALLKSRENFLYEESNVRMRNIVQSVNQRQTRLTNSSKRLCPNDSEASSSDEDTSQIDNSLQENVKIKQSLGVCDNCSAQTIKIAQLLQTIKRSDDQIAELQGDLADQKDIIENLMHELDRIRVENRRLDFTVAQQQQHFVSSNDSLKADDLDDSCITINLPKITAFAHNHATDKMNSLSFYGSPESKVTIQGNGNQSLNNETPSTIVKGPNKLLPGEKQPLPDYTIQHSVDPEKKYQANDEVKCIHHKNEYITNDVRESRISEGLLSFLEHESSFQHQEIVEQLRRQIYEIEEKFALKHDALVKSETAFHELKAQYEDLSQRLISQTNELHQSNLKLTKLKQLHAEELKICNDDAQKRIDQMKTDLKVALEQNNALLACVPNTDMNVQTSIIVEPSIHTDSISMQTSLCQMNELSMQVSSLSLGVSIGIQTEEHNEVDASKSVCAVNAAIPHQNEELSENNSTCISENPINQVKRNLRNASRLRLKQNGGRLTQRLGPPKLPNLPSPIPSSICLSDSELELSVTLHEEEVAKENINDTSDEETEENDDEDDIRSCKSEPRNTNRRPARHRQVIKALEKTSPKQQKRQTRSTAAVSITSTNHRRLPPLAESTQLLPDSFFQEQLDEALESVDIELKKTEQRNLRQLHSRQGTRKRR
ncbi:putative rabkinesin-6 [Schistosoma mansoni]|uniref:putative rabkinesin-6 n=1 Tax=Schistosoma mansoni TaxID=6183 RepID=UPI00022DC494|nr:putative rabkinesin-6 [Schistosoma mansoni]|eukprot:XP_018649848.1 putative rabkinesin-6 [Schistosoma mansoni]